MRGITLIYCHLFFTKHGKKIIFIAMNPKSKCIQYSSKVWRRQIVFELLKDQCIYDNSTLHGSTSRVCWNNMGLGIIFKYHKKNKYTAIIVSCGIHVAMCTSLSIMRKSRVWIGLFSAWSATGSMCLLYK